MKPKIQFYPNGWFVYLDKNGFMYRITIRTAGGELHSTARCYDRKSALTYNRIFCNIARNA
jgi:hypothetical protein